MLGINRSQQMEQKKPSESSAVSALAIKTMQDIVVAINGLTQTIKATLG
jgi:hypothetical protein